MHNHSTVSLYTAGSLDWLPSFFSFSNFLAHRIRIPSITISRKAPPSTLDLATNPRTTSLIPFTKSQMSTTRPMPFDHAVGGKLATRVAVSTVSWGKTVSIVIPAPDAGSLEAFVAVGAVFACDVDVGV